MVQSYLFEGIFLTGALGFVSRESFLLAGMLMVQDCIGLIVMHKEPVGKYSQQAPEVCMLMACWTQATNGKATKAF